MDRPRILLVEGAEEASARLRVMLDELGFDVAVTARTAEEAIRLTFQTVPDLVLMNVSLPEGGSGIETAATILAKLDVPIVYLASQDEGRMSREALRTSPYGYLLEPIDQRGLEATVEMTLHRHRLHLQLKERETEFRTLVENVPGTVYRCELDAPWRMFQLSDAVEQLTGRPKQDFLEGRITWADVTFPADLRLVVDGVAESVAVREPYSLIYRIVHSSGEVRWIHDSGRCIYGAEGDPKHLDGVILDITRGKHAELRYQEVWDRSIDAMRLIDRDGRLVDVNNAFVSLFGVARENLIGKPFTCVYKSEMQSRFLREMLDRIKQGTVQARDEVLTQLWDGREIWMDVASGLVDVDGTELVLSILRDTSGRKKIEQELQQSESRFVQAAELTREMIWQMDPDGLYTYVSDACTQILGYRPDEIVGKLHYFDLYPEQYREKLVAETRAASVRGGGIRNFLNMMQAKDGRILEISSNAEPVYAPDGTLKGFLGADRDVTEQRRTEAHLAQVQKMESVGRLAGGIAHDFNNLLTVINGYSQMALEKLDPDDPVRGHLREIIKAGDRAARLTKQLLAFSRNQVLEPQMLDLNSVVREIRPMIERLMGENIRLDFDLPPSAARVCADRHQLEQVVINLAVNARDAMPVGGSLGLSTGLARLEHHTPTSATTPVSGRFVTLSVADSGTGMDEATRRRVFEPFFTTKEVGRGTGLGLSIVHGIVEQSNGFIELRSQPGKGTTFTIYLPAMASGRGAEQAGRMGATQELDTILIVEDEPVLRTYATEVLSVLGYRVLSAGNAEEASVLFEQEADNVQLLVADLALPGLNGKEIAAKLRAAKPGLKVLYMSGFAEGTMTAEEIEREGASLIEKPFLPNRFAEKVREMLANGRVN